jgi:hypothetical protein
MATARSSTSDTPTHDSSELHTAKHNCDGIHHGYDLLPVADDTQMAAMDTLPAICLHCRVMGNISTDLQI